MERIKDSVTGKDYAAASLAQAIEACEPEYAPGNQEFSLSAAQQRAFEQMEVVQRQPDIGDTDLDPNETARLDGLDDLESPEDLGHSSLDGPDDPGGPEL